MTSPVNTNLFYAAMYLKQALNSPELQDYTLRDDNLLEIKGLIVSAQSMIRLTQQRTKYLKILSIKSNSQ